MNLSKSATISISALLIVSVSGCSGEPQPTVTVTVTEQAPVKASQTAEASAPEVIDEAIWEDFLSYKLVEFSVSNSECSYSDGSLTMRVTFTNKSERDILAIEASAAIEDIFGESLKGLNISSDESLGSGDSINVGSWGSTCYDLNDFSSDDKRLLDMEDLEKTTDVVIGVTKIAFADGEVLEF